MEIFEEHFMAKEINCNDNHLLIVNRLLNALQEKQSIHEDDRFRMKLSLVEAICNAKKHGNRERENKTVIVSCILLKECVRFLVKDEGNGYQQCKPTLNDQENGRGLLLIQQLSDRVQLLDNGRSTQMDFHI